MMFRSYRDFAERDSSSLAVMLKERTGVTAGINQDQLLAANRRSDSGDDTASSKSQYEHFRGHPYSVVRAIGQRAAGQRIIVARRIRPGSKRRGKHAEAWWLKANPWLSAAVQGMAERLDVLDQHEFLDRMERPNSLNVGWTLKYVTLVSLELTGRAFWWLPQVKQERQIVHLPSHWVTAEHDGKPFSQWMVTLGGMGAKVPVPREDIAQLFYPSPSDPLGAVSPMEANAKAVLIDEYIQEAQQRSFKQGIHPGMAVIIGEHSGPGGIKMRPRLKRRQLHQIRASLMHRLRGLSRWDEPVIFDRLISDIKPITTKPADMDFSGSTKLSRARVSQGFGVNPTIIGENEGTNYAQAAVAERLFLEGCLNPKLALLSQVITVFVLPRFDDSEGMIAFIEPARADDPVQTLQEWSVALTNGTVTVNQFNERVLGLPKAPGLDIYLRRMGVNEVPAGERKPEQPPAAEPPPMEGGPQQALGGPQAASGAEAGEITEPQIAGGGQRRLGRLARYKAPADKEGSRQRQGVTRAAALDWWLKQHGQSETHMAKALAAFFARQAKEVAGRLSLRGDPEAIVARAFDPGDWNSELIKTLEPSLIYGLAAGALIPLAAWGVVDTAPKLPEAAPESLERAIGQGDFFGFSVDFPDEVVRGLTRFANKLTKQPFLTDINATTKQRLTTQIRTGVEAGETLKEIRDRIYDVLGGDGGMRRAELIARTESTGILNSGAHEADLYLADEGLVETKDWIATLDMRTREDHYDMDGVSVPIGEKFELPDGSECWYPGDYELPPEQRCNCRCATSTLTALSDERSTAVSIRVPELAGVLTEVAKVFCPTGPGGGIDPTCSPGESGGGGSFSHSVDVAKWPQHNSAAVSAKKKIYAMTDLLLKGDIDAFMAAKPVILSKSPNAYQKGTLKAWQEMHASYLAKATAAPAEGIKPTQPGSVVGDASGWKQVGNQLGSNPGGVYEDESGQKYYVKFPADEKHAFSEALASKLYGLAGSSTAQVDVISKDGKLGVASKWLDSEKADWNDSDVRELAQLNFATHAWLANWDAIGHVSEMDNVRIVGEGIDAKAVTVDVGGSLDYRAQGGLKGDLFGSEVKEWDGMRSAAVNPSAAKVFGGMHHELLLESAEKVAAISNDDIRGLVNKYHQGSYLERQAFTAKLIARKDDIQEKAAELTAELEAAHAEVNAEPESDEADKLSQSIAALASAPVDDDGGGEKTPASPVPPEPPAIPGPPTITSQANLGAQNKLNAIHAAAASGDINKLLAIKTNGTGNTYAKMAHKYKESVLAAMKLGGKVSDGDLKAAQANAKPVTAPKIDPASFPEKPEFLSSTFKAVNNEAVEKALAFAKAGDLDGLKSMDVSKSSKLASWHSELVGNLANQLNPPPPPKEYTGKLKDLADKVRPLTGSAKDKAERVGKYIVLGKNVGTPPEEVLKSNLAPEQWGTGKSAFDKLNSVDKALVKSYTGGGYGGANSALRGIGNHDLDDAYKMSAAYVKAQVPLNEGYIWRGHHLSIDDKKALQQSVGSVIQERGLMSTSRRESVARDFGGGGVVWKLHIPKGVRGLPVKHFSNHNNEDELVLPPNSRLHVLAVKGDEYGTLEAEAVVLPWDDSQCCPP